MSTTVTMTPDAVAVRAEMVADGVAKYGRKTVEKWAADPGSRSVFNAVAQVIADMRREDAAKHPWRTKK